MNTFSAKAMAAACAIAAAAFWGVKAREGVYDAAAFDSWSEAMQALGEELFLLYMNEAEPRVREAHVAEIDEMMKKSFPLQWEQVHRDSGGKIADWLDLEHPPERQKKIIKMALDELEALGADCSKLRLEFTRLENEDTPGFDADWMKLYERACALRSGRETLGPVLADIERVGGDAAPIRAELEALEAGAGADFEDSWRILLGRAVELLAAKTAEFLALPAGFPAAATNRWGAIGFAALLPEAGAADLLEEEIRDIFDEWQRQIRIRPQLDAQKLQRQAFRRDALIWESDRTPLDVAWRRAQSLLEHIEAMPEAPDLSRERQWLEMLRGGVERLQKMEGAAPECALRLQFGRVYRLARHIAFCNPRLDFDRILFIKRHPALYHHMCDQYYGIAARPGGGLYVLENAFSGKPLARDLLADAVVEKGRLKGRKLNGGADSRSLSYDGEGKLRESGAGAAGAFLSPELSYDGRQILFCYVEKMSHG